MNTKMNKELVKRNLKVLRESHDMSHALHTLVDRVNFKLEYVPSLIFGLGLIYTAIAFLKSELYEFYGNLSVVVLIVVFTIWLCIAGIYKVKCEKELEFYKGLLEDEHSVRDLAWERLNLLEEVKLFKK